MPPSCQYSVTQAEADETIPDTKGRESRTPPDFPLHNSPFLGTAGRGHHRHLGPLAADAVMVGEAMPLLRQYFLSQGKKGRI